MWIMTAEGWKQLQPRVCTPAQGVFKPVTIEQARIENAKRVDGYARNVQRYINEEIRLEDVYRCWTEPVLGAYGETLR